MSSSQDYTKGLTAEQLAQFDRDGYLVLENFFSGVEADELKTHADELIDSLDLSKHPKTIFKSDTSGSQTGAVNDGKSSIFHDENLYFLDSADKIGFFFEEHAWNADGTLKVEKNKAINKIGHALHVLDPVFRRFTNQKTLQSLACALGYSDPIVLQSMVICKQPQIGGEVTKHRDSTFLYTEPQSSAKGMWFALEDCTKDNGCLYFVPGSHKDGASNRRFQRTGELKRSVNNKPFGFTGKDDEYIQGGPNNTNIKLNFVGEDKKSYPDEDFVAAEVKKGSLVLIHGEVVHMSSHNHSSKSRYIYTFHMIEGDEKLVSYPERNWLQSKDPFVRMKQAVQQ